MIPTWADFIGGWPLFRDPILCATVAGAVLGWAGVHVVLRRMVFVTASLTQAAGLGVALAYWAGLALGAEVDPTAGAVLVSGVAAALLSARPERLRLSRETLLALVWIAGSAGALLVGERIAQEAHDVAGILFGSAVLVRPEDLAMVAATGGAALAAALLAHRGLVFAGWDPDGARVQRLPVRWIDLLFLVGLTAVVATATRALGALPVFAFAVLPGLAGLLAAPRLALAFPLALAAGAISGSAGYLVAFFLSFPVGASQSAVALALALLAVPLRLARGTA